MAQYTVTAEPRDVKAKGTRKKEVKAVEELTEDDFTRMIRSAKGEKAKVDKKKSAASKKKTRA